MLTTSARPSRLQCLALGRTKVAELRQRLSKSTDSASSSRNASKSLPGERVLHWKMAHVLVGPAKRYWEAWGFQML